MSLRVASSLLCLILVSTTAWPDEEYQDFLMLRLWDNETTVEHARHLIETLDSDDSTEDLIMLHDEARTEIFGDEIRSTVESVSDAVAGLPAESLLSTDNRTTVKKLDHRAWEYFRDYYSLGTYFEGAIRLYENAADLQADLDSESGSDSNEETPTGHICDRLGDAPDFLVKNRCEGGNRYLGNARERLEELKAHKTAIDGLLDDLVIPESEE